MEWLEDNMIPIPQGRLPLLKGAFGVRVTLGLRLYKISICSLTVNDNSSISRQYCSTAIIILINNTVDYI